MSDQEFHLAAAEYHLACARGEDLGVHPGMFRMPTANELGTLRRRCKLTKGEVADRVGCTSTYIGNIECGQQAPGREMIQNLITLYRHEWPAGVDVEEVVEA